MARPSTAIEVVLPEARKVIPMLYPRRFLLVLIVLPVLPVLGCGNHSPTYAVTGTVTYHGLPVEGACVMFIPQGGRPASGKTDAQGHFTLLSYAAGDGAVAGEHTVCIAKNVPDPKDQSDSPYKRANATLPSIYSTPLKSPLRATIATRGPNDFTFDLSD
jgi:hypothetical protein